MALGETETELANELRHYSVACNAADLAWSNKQEAEANYRDAKEMEIARLILAGVAPTRAERDCMQVERICKLRTKRDDATVTSHHADANEKTTLQKLEAAKLRYQRATVTHLYDAGGTTP